MAVGFQGMSFLHFLTHPGSEFELLRNQPSAADNSAGSLMYVITARGAQKNRTLLAINITTLALSILALATLPAIPAIFPAIGLIGGGALSALFINDLYQRYTALLNPIPPNRASI